MNKKYNTVGCGNCEFLGQESDLILLPDGQEYFKGCPNCKTDGFLFDINNDNNKK